MSDSVAFQLLRVLIVDDHPVFRQGLQSLLGTQADMVVTGAVADAAGALDKVMSTQPDVVLLDLRLAECNGLTVLRQLKQLTNAPKVLVVSSHEGDVMVARALKAGADGYVSKNAPSVELISAIRKVKAGARALSRELGRRYTEKAGQPTLTSRETQILQLVARGLSNKEVGANLGLAEKTVKNHLNAIYMKLDASDRTHAVMIAMDRGMIDPSGA